MLSVCLTSYNPVKLLSKVIPFYIPNSNVQSFLLMGLLFMYILSSTVKSSENFPIYLLCSFYYLLEIFIYSSYKSHDR